MPPANLSLVAGWAGMLGGILSGAWIGLFFTKEGWLGGYGSHARRLTRLGHIAFFGLGFVNILYGLSVERLGVVDPYLTVGSYGLIVALITMPVCCFLTARWTAARHLFPIPVIAAAVGVLALLVSSLS